LGLNIPCDEAIATAATSPLAQPITHVRINGKHIGNRIAIQPMEGWDGTSTGGASDETRRRWRRFGESGAKLIYGGEAMLRGRTDARTRTSSSSRREQEGHHRVARDSRDSAQGALRQHRRSGDWLPTHAFRPLL